MRLPLDEPPSGSGRPGYGSVAPESMNLVRAGRHRVEPIVPGASSRPARPGTSTDRSERPLRDPSSLIGRPRTRFGQVLRSHRRCSRSRAAPRMPSEPTNHRRQRFRKRPRLPIDLPLDGMQRWDTAVHTRNGHPSARHRAQLAIPDPHNEALPVEAEFAAPSVARDLPSSSTPPAEHMKIRHSHTIRSLRPESVLCKLHM
jgi:hypothetical protein